MENQIQLFNFEDQQVRTLRIDGEPYFVGKDVAEILGYSNTRDALRKHVDREDKKSEIVKASQMSQNATGYMSVDLITESGVYALIFGSKMPNAKKFKRWVTHEVLPAIRKHGAYMTDEKSIRRCEQQRWPSKFTTTSRRPTPTKRYSNRGNET